MSSPKDSQQDASTDASRANDDAGTTSQDQDQDQNDHVDTGTGNTDHDNDASHASQSRGGDHHDEHGNVRHIMDMARSTMSTSVRSSHASGRRRRRTLSASAFRDGDIQAEIEDVSNVDDWHELTVDAALARLDVDDVQHGLTSQEVHDRHAAFGSNALSEGSRRSTLAILISHFFNVLTLVLTAVFIIAIVNEEWVEAVVVVLIIFINSSIGAWQETKSEKAMEALKHLASSSNATVVRDGRTQEVPIKDVVLGDIIVLRHGQQVPADVRLIEATHLEVDEAILTGESIPVAKVTTPVLPDHDGDTVAVGDRINMAFRQTGVTQGTGRGVVVAVGAASQIGKIAQRLAKRGGASNKTPLTISMNRLFYLLFLLGLIFAVFIFWAFEWEGSSEALLYASATFVAILPEAAIVLITVTMAIGSRRMADRNAIVRKLVALEQLGRVTDICSDKTGTLTLGSMRPARLILYTPAADDKDHLKESPVTELSISGPAMSREGNWLREAGNEDSAVDLSSWCEEDDTGRRSEALHQALLVAALCAGTRLYPKDDGIELEGSGNPTEVALQELVQKAIHSMPDLEAKLWDAHESRGEWSFNSTLKRMTMGYVHKESGKSISLTKGAPESILSLCVNVTEKQKKRVLSAAARAAKNGLRVLALARRDDLDLKDTSIHDMERDNVECDLHFVGLAALRDPPKPESKPAVEECFHAGITVRMLTGDHKDTAVAIAKEIGILPDAKTFPRGMVLTGPQLDSMSEEELDELPDLPLVVARSSPETKVKVVEALHRRSRVVAMTGDGVNDSPAIKEADVGIAMGQTGSDVTKGVADIVLADDNFATIVMAVREGRRIFDSISQFVMHLLSGNAAEAVALLISLAFLTDADGLPIFVMGPLAILYLNTATGSGPAIGLALDDPAPDLMSRPPMRRSIFSWELVIDFLVYGFLMGGLTLVGFSLSFYVGLDAEGSDAEGCNTSSNPSCHDVERARGVTFLTLHTLLLIHAYNCRHQRLPFWKLPLLKNRVLLGSLIIGTAVTVLWLYVPWLNNKVFKQRGIGWEWGMVVAICIVFMACAELYKLCKRALFGVQRSEHPTAAFDGLSESGGSALTSKSTKSNPNGTSMNGSQAPTSHADVQSNPGQRYADGKFVVTVV